MRLDWQDVFRVPGHIEITAIKSKTRSRRLVEMPPALAEWLEPYRGRTGRIWLKSVDMFHTDFGTLRDTLKIPNRRNGLRHGFVSYHYALHADEGLTAKNAGNSPSMVHKHYKGLATKAEAEKWFNVLPPKVREERIPFAVASRQSK
jgi:integrase